MRKVSVEVVEDASRPDGGHAVILLHGVDSLPDGVTFRLKPLDVRVLHEAVALGAWPQGDQRPVALRRTDSGMGLLIGPDIVECPALLPGTLGVIEILSVGIRGEFLWPSVRPTSRPRRRNLTIVRPSGRGAASPPALPPPSPGGSPSAAVLRSDSARMQEPLAAMSAARFRREEADVAPEVVRVTALDHAAPAAATVAEAVGARIVQLSTAREAVSAGAGAARSEHGATDAGAVAHVVAVGDGATASDREVVTVRRGAYRPAVIATVAAVLVAGGVLLLLQRQNQGERSALAERDAARLVSRAEPVTRAETLRGAPDPAEPLAPRAAPPDETPFEPSAPAPDRPAEQPTDTVAAPGNAPTPQLDVAPVAPPPPPPASQEVTLRMRGGGFQIAGELKGFDGAKYVIETRFAGTLTMDASRFECAGDACNRPATPILALSERPSPVKPDVFRIEGAPSLAAEFIPQLIREYAQSIGATASALASEPGQPARLRIADQRGAELATIEIQATGTAAGLSALERGTAALALVDVPLGPDLERHSPTFTRRRGATPALPPAQPTEIVIGLDGIALVGSPATAPASITLDNMAKVLAGQISDWYELGGQPGAIALYLPPEGSATIDTIVDQLLRPRNLELSRSARRLPTEADAADAAIRDPRGLALVAFAAQRGARAMSIEMSCGLIVRPTAFAVKTGEYPLLRRLSLKASAQMPQPSARGLMRIANAGDITQAVSAARLVDPSIASLPIEEQAERMAWAANAPASAFDAAELRQMLSDLEGATRLSVTFRYIAGTNELDQRSRPEIARLAAALKEPELAGRRIILAGFTDAGGKFQANKTIGLKRAGQVRSALLAAAGPDLEAKLVTARSYGPLAPVGCGGTSEGSKLNRRVEVWVAR